MPQLDFSWWIIHLLINWTLWATAFLIVSNWSNTFHLSTNNSN
uniref:ATP synthase F0 subunit 8 n=1 Tax=Silax daleus TaxID=3230861 RepID=A0AAU8HNE3_9ECHI